MARLQIAAAGAATVALACASGASAAGGGLPQTGWATVNVCSPGQLGIRARLPGDPRADGLRVRFTAQWLDRASGAWKPVGGAATSPWLGSGRARWRWWEDGWTFTLAPVPAGQSWTLRGVAEMQWLSGGSVLRGAQAVSGGSCTLGEQAPAQ